MGKTVYADNSKPSKPLKKKSNDDVLTKVIIRRLPPYFEKDKLLRMFAEIFPEGLPEYDYFRFCGSDLSFSPVPFCRTYINFKNSKDILKFKERLDGYVFADAKGVQYPVVVEFAPFQGIPRRTKRRKDIKCGTIEKDSDYLSFLETLNQEIEPLPSAEVYLEQQEASKQSMKDAKITTPLIEFIKMKRTSGKSRITSQRPSSSSNASDKKRKAPKETVKAVQKNSFSEKSSRPRSANESSKRGSERKADDFRTSRKNEKDDSEKKRGFRGNEKKTGKPNGWKEKTEKEEKEKTVKKDRPTSTKSWKETRTKDNYDRSGSGASRPSSSYRTPARGEVTKEQTRGSENAAKDDLESGHSAKGERSSERREDRTPSKQQMDKKDRVRNKDRPAQAIYQPRSRTRVDTDDSAVKNAGRLVNKEPKDRPPAKNYRENSSRDRDNRDGNRRQGRDNQKTRSKPEETRIAKE